MESAASPKTGKSNTILSVYLSIGQSESLHPEIDVQLIALLNEVEHTIQEPGDRLEFAAAACHVRRFVQQHHPSARSLVVFANPKGILQTLDLDVGVENQAQWGRPAIHPSAESLVEIKTRLQEAT
jgi:hypothetical protein